MNFRAHKPYNTRAYKYPHVGLDLMGWREKQSEVGAKKGRAHNGFGPVHKNGGPTKS